MEKIFTALLYELEKGHDCVLVSIVSDCGSAPRGKGSQMLISGEGRVQGTIGGGAVEKYSEDMARSLLPEKRSALHLFTLRTNDREDIGMVCGGDVLVHFQFIDHSEPDWTAFAGELLARIRGQQPGWLLLSRNGAFPKLAPTPEAEAFSLPLPLGERAYIFGGGHIALALTPLLASIGFRVTVMDNRPEYADPQRFPQAEAVVCGDYTRLKQYFTLTPEDYAIVMTNGHSFDYEAEKQILLGDFAYLGVIGSRKKTAAVNAKLLADGLSQSLLDQVHTPIGLPILAVTPEEIAVSIAAEMILVRARRREQAGSAPSHACPMH